MVLDRNRRAIIFTFFAHQPTRSRSTVCEFEKNRSTDFRLMIFSKNIFRDILTFFSTFRKKVTNRKIKVDVIIVYNSFADKKKLGVGGKFVLRGF